MAKTPIQGTSRALATDGVGQDLRCVPMDVLQAIRGRCVWKSYF